MSVATRLGLLIICLLVATISRAQVSEATYQVSYVYDGDTVKLTRLGDELKLRLVDIDAPERDQEDGLKSRRALMKLCQGDDILVTVQIVGADKYHRSLGKMQCNQVDASLYMAEHGWAWHYAQYSSDAAIHDAALGAREQRLGLWANDNPMPPWVWRSHHAHTYKYKNHVFSPQVFRPHFYR